MQFFNSYSSVLHTIYTVVHTTYICIHNPTFTKQREAATALTMSKTVTAPMKACRVGGHLHTAHAHIIKRAACACVNSPFQRVTMNGAGLLLFFLAQGVLSLAETSPRDLDTLISAEQNVLVRNSTANT